jgi:hypothetical protein
MLVSYHLVHSCRSLQPNKQIIDICKFVQHLQQSSRKISNKQTLEIEQS